MLVSDFLSICDFDSNDKFLVHFDDIDFTESIYFSSLQRYCWNKIVTLSQNSDGTLVLVLRCS